MSIGGEVIQVVVTEAMRGPFSERLASRGLYPYPIPVENDLPTFGIGVKDGQR